jgi:hypothetical protein
MRVSARSLEEFADIWHPPLGGRPLAWSFVESLVIVIGA